MKILRVIAIRHPYALATVLFIGAMTFVKLGAEKIVDGYGTTGTLITIGALVVIGAMIDRR